jgi:RNA polymerase sigma factor (sigma-70 family)
VAETTYLAGLALGGAEQRSLRAALFERILDRIHRYFARLVFDPHGVEDCLQQTLLALEKSLQEGTYDPQQSFNRWMWIKAHSVWVDYCRARAREPRRTVDEVAGGAARGGDGSSGVDAKLDAQALLAALGGRLSAEDLECFTLFFGEDQTVTDIAAVVGMDRKTVKKRIDAARRLALEVLGGVPRRAE